MNVESEPQTKNWVVLSASKDHKTKYGIDTKDSLQPCFTSFTHTFPSVYPFFQLKNNVLYLPMGIHRDGGMVLRKQV